MILTRLLGGLLLAPMAWSASLTKVNYPNNATSKVDMYELPIFPQMSRYLCRTS
jgi:hypothetical protein